MPENNNSAHLSIDLSIYLSIYLFVYLTARYRVLDICVILYVCTYYVHYYYIRLKPWHSSTEYSIQTGSNNKLAVDKG